jgi:membrane protease YdiL (CAAX protease family)
LRTNIKGVFAFLAIAFSVAWLLWEIPLLLGVPVNSLLFSFLVVPGAFSPALAAYVVRKWVTKEGFADAGLTLSPFKWPYYALAWLIPISVLVFGILVAPWLGHGEPALMGRGIPLPILIGPISLYAMLATPILWGEEFGWRSYLQIRLVADRPLVAAILTGLIWGVWHFPLLAAGSELPDHPYLIFAIFPLATILYSIIFGWLRIRSGSIWVSSFAHSAVNNLGSSVLVSTFPHSSDKLGLVLLGLVPLLLISLVIVASGSLKAPSLP